MTKIIQQNCLQLYKDDMGRYSKYVLRRRVIPSGKDGLKLIHRRIVYAEFAIEKSINHTVKSAAVVGSVMKTLHPHGDTSIYDAMKPLTNWFQINTPLLEGQGNWGGLEGDSQAASRYTETKLSPFAVECLFSELKDVNNLVNWIETYDGKHKEPENLPAMIPLLLINGTYGIAVGMRNYIPPHSINDVIDATIKLMKNPDSQVVIIPDQALTCEIVETNFKSICNKGNGQIVVRGIIDIEDYADSDKKTYKALVIKSVPDLSALANVNKKLLELIEAKKLPQVRAIYHETTDQEMRHVIVLNKGADPNYVRDYLYKSNNLGLKKTHSINFEVLVGYDPIRMNYKSYLEYFIDFRKTTKFTYYCNKLQQVQTRMHEIETYIKVLQSGEVDNIINMIKNQTEINDTYIIEYLISKLGITDLQAAFIINTNIKRLSAGYLNKYIEEFQSLYAEKDKYMNMIVDPNAIEEEMIQELLYFKKKYGKPRKSKIISQSELNNIPQGEFKIVITESNFIKKLGVKDSIGYIKDTTVAHALIMNNTKSLLLFDARGKVFSLPVHKIPLSEKSHHGIDMRTLLKNLSSNIIAVIPEDKIEELSKKTSKYFITVLTQNGNIKKLEVDDFLTVTPSGLLYMKLDDNDMIVNASVVSHRSDIIVYTDNKALRINAEDIPHQKRSTKGVKSINEGPVDGLTVIKKDTTSVVVVTEKGYMNKFDIVALPRLSRNVAPINVIKLTKEDKIKEIFAVNEDDSVRIRTKNNVVDILVNSVSFGSSISGGTKVVSTKVDPIIRCDIIKKN